MPAEVLDDDLSLLANDRGVERGEAGCPALSAAVVKLRVILNRLLQLVIGLVGHEILEHDQDKAFFDGLSHGVEMEGERLPVRSGRPKAFQRDVARRCREGEETDVGLRAPLLLVFRHDVLNFLAAGRLASKGVSESLGTLAGLAAVSLIDDHRKGAPFLPGNLVSSGA